MDSDAKQKTINNIKTILSYSYDKILKSIYMTSPKIYTYTPYIKIKMSSTSFWNAQGFAPV